MPTLISSVPSLLQIERAHSKAVICEPEIDAHFFWIITDKHEKDLARLLPMDLYGLAALPFNR